MYERKCSNREQKVGRNVPMLVWLDNCYWLWAGLCKEAKKFLKENEWGGHVYKADGENVVWSLSYPVLIALTYHDHVEELKEKADQKGKEQAVVDKSSHSTDFQLFGLAFFGRF